MNSKFYVTYLLVKVKTILIYDIYVNKNVLGNVFWQCISKIYRHVLNL